MQVSKTSFFITWLACWGFFTGYAQQTVLCKDITRKSDLAYYNGALFTGKAVLYSLPTKTDTSTYVRLSVLYEAGIEQSVTTYSHDGQTTSFHNKKTGEYKEWFEVPKGSTQHLSREGTFKKLKHGQWTFYYPTGKKRAQGNFTYGKKTGSWSYWKADGSPDPDYEKRKSKESKDLALDILKLPLYLLYGFK